VSQKRTRKKRRNRGYKVKRLMGGNAKFLTAMGDFSCHYQRNAKTKLLLDSGCTDNICSKEFAENHSMHIDDTQEGLKTYKQVNGTKVKDIATAWWETTVVGQDMTTEFAVLPELGTKEAILGYVWMRDWDIKQDFGSGEIEIERNNPIGKTLSQIAEVMVSNALQEKMKKQEEKSWKEVIPEKYHKYEKAFN
jgi:hypothetical protein